MPKLSHAPLSPRAEGLLRCIAISGPLYYRQVRRALVVADPKLVARSSADRLLYFALQRLLKQRLLDRKRPPGSNAAVYYLTPHGAELVLERGLVGRVDEGAEGRFFQFPDHEAIVHDVLVEFMIGFATLESVVDLTVRTDATYQLASDTGAVAYRPDALLGLVYTTKTGMILVEVDRATESLRRWEDKIGKAEGVLQSVGRQARLLVVCETRKRLNSLRSVTTAVLEPDTQAKTRWIVASALVGERLTKAQFEDLAGEPAFLVSFKPPTTNSA